MIAYVCLGRFGDIINALPMSWEHSRISGPVCWIVSSDFASVLEGCSYVRPVIYDGPYWDIQGAVRTFRDQYDELRIVQPWSQNWPGCRISDSFCRSAWAQVGRADWPGRLVFDRRDRSREANLLITLKHAHDRSRSESECPPILVSLDSTSSPFTHRMDLLENLRTRFGGHRVWPLDPIAHRIYDLIGLFERAACLVTVDTAHLHLSWAIPRLPVVALIADHPDAWHGTACRPNQAFRLRYGEYQTGRQDLLQAVEQGLTQRAHPKLLHVWSDYDRSAPDTARHAVAARGWEEAYATGRWVARPFRGQTRRLGQRELPLVSDLLDNAAKSAADDDLLVLTNDDTGFASGLTDTLLEVASYARPAAFAHRLDTQTDRPLTVTGTIDGEPYPGVDLFAIGVRLWREWRLTYPPCVIGAEQWDLAMLALMRQVGAPSLGAAVWHNAHQPHWVGPDAYEANAHNRREAGRWFDKLGITANDVIENVI